MMLQHLGSFRSFSFAFYCQTEALDINSNLDQDIKTWSYFAGTLEQESGRPPESDAMRDISVSCSRLMDGVKIDRSVAERERVKSGLE